MEPDAAGGAALRGEVDLAHYRGRAGLPAAVLTSCSERATGDPVGYRLERVEELPGRGQRGPDSRGSLAFPTRDSRQARYTAAISPTTRGSVCR